MRDHSIWSISLGRWGGLHLRLHMFFLLFAALTLYLGWREGQQIADDGIFWIGAASLLILLVSVLLHELGHCYAALSLGGTADQIVVGPLGGLAPVKLPNEPLYELLAVLAGPLVNLMVCLSCMPPLLVRHGSAAWGLLNPLQPENFPDSPAWLVGVQLTFWINWVLVLVNLIPAFPLDGGRALRAVLSLLLPTWSERDTALVVATLARLAAIGMIVAAWLLRDANPTVLVPTWFALVFLSIFLFFSAKQEVSRLDDEAEDDGPFGYDFSQGYTSLEREETYAPRPEVPGPFAQWLRHRREAKRRHQREIEVEEERRVDDVLIRLHKSGLDGLSTEERALLHRVSARYRSRPRG